MTCELTEQEIEEVLKENIWGHLGCNDGFNTYVFPINYLYNGQHIICHSQVGFKVEIMRRNNRVCMQVDEVKNHKNWKSVMVLGEYQELTDERDRYYAMKEFVDRRLYLKISGHPLSGSDEEQVRMELKDTKPAIYRIVIDEKTGRYEND